MTTETHRNEIIHATQSYYWSDRDNAFIDYDEAKRRQALGATIKIHIAGHPSYGRSDGKNNWPSHGFTEALPHD